MSTSYFQNLVISVKDLVSDVLIEDSFVGSFLRRGRTVCFSDSEDNLQTNDVLLRIISHEINDNEESNVIRVPSADDTVLIFRAPSQIAMSFMISAPKIDPMTKLKMLDRLIQYFFNNRSVEPFLPDDLKRYPELYKKLANTRATLRPIKLDKNNNTQSENLYAFEYSALYHSGMPIREEKTVQRRVVDIAPISDNQKGMKVNL